MVSMEPSALPDGKERRGEVGSNFTGVLLCGAIELALFYG